MTKICSLHARDAVSFLKDLDDGSIDLVITDPPYESLEKYRKVGTTTRLKQSTMSSNAWFETFPNERFGELAVELFRVLKKKTHLYIFSDTETMFALVPEMRQAGFTFRNALVWDKRRLGMGYSYRRRYEHILFFGKGKRKLADLSVPDVLDQFRSPSPKTARPTEKPVELIELLVTQSSRPGDLVCDPFYGSGSTAIAALRRRRRFVGTDTSQDCQLFATTMVQKELEELESFLETGVGEEHDA